MTIRPWVKSYPPNVRWDAPLELSSVQSVLETAAERFGLKPALDFMNKRLTYAELDALANHAAAGFQKLGVKPGVHVGLYLPNTPHYVIAFFGVLKAGGVVVNYSPLDALPTLQLKVNDSETDILVTLDLASLYPQAEKLLASTRLKTLVVGEFAEMTPAPGLIKAQMKAGGMLADVPRDNAHVAFRDLIDNDGHYQVHPLGALADELAVIQYTGGTTGSPKGAMLSHANLTAACSLYAEVRNAQRRRMASGRGAGPLHPAAVSYLFADRGHAARISAGLGARPSSALRSGGGAQGHRRKEDHDLYGRADDACRASQRARRREDGFFVVALVLIGRRAASGCGAGAVRERHRLQVDRRLGHDRDRAARHVHAAPGTEKTRVVRCSLSGTEMKFIDVANPEREVKLGERGEICVKGPNVTKGYWKKPEATANSMTADGFFRTGDVGYMDEDGFVYIVDRTKDMLLCGGFNVYPRNIEEAIYQHPSVEEVSVIGIPDDYRGETPKAFVTLKAGAAPLTLEEMKAFLKDRVGKHEMIGAMEIRDALPKTPVGKISKKDLREYEARAHAEA